MYKNAIHKELHKLLFSSKNPKSTVLLGLVTNRNSRGPSARSELICEKVSLTHLRRAAKWASSRPRREVLKEWFTQGATRSCVSAILPATIRSPITSYLQCADTLRVNRTPGLELRRDIDTSSVILLSDVLINSFGVIDS